MLMRYARGCFGLNIAYAIYRECAVADFQHMAPHSYVGFTHTPSFPYAAD